MFRSFWFSLVYSWVKMSLLPHRITELQILKEFHLTHLLIVKHERPEAPTGKRFAPGLEFTHPVYSLIGLVTMYYLVYSETRLFLCVSFGNAIQAAESAAKIRYNTSSLGIRV